MRERSPLLSWSTCTLKEYRFHETLGKSSSLSCLSCFSQFLNKIFGILSIQHHQYNKDRATTCKLMLLDRVVLVA